MRIAFLSRRRPDKTYVINLGGSPYHVVQGDPLYAECEAAYTVDDNYGPEMPPFSGKDIPGGVWDQTKWPVKRSK